MTILAPRPAGSAVATVSGGRAGIALPLGVALAVYATVVARGSAVLADPDPYAHIATGRWILAHYAIPHSDPFSHSVPGRAWVAHEWLAEVATAWLYDHVGWSGLVFATAILFAAALAMLVAALRRYIEAPWAIVAGIAAWGLCLPHLLARPHLFALPLLVLWVAGLVAARAAERAPSPWLAAAMVLWANLHGSYMFGLGLAALIAGEAVFEAADWRTALARAARWGGFGALALLAAAATPHGFAGLALPFELMGMETGLSRVKEWQSPDFQQTQPLELWLMLVLLAALLLGLRVPVTRIAMVLVLLHMALAHQRHGEILGLVAPLLVAPALAPQIRDLVATSEVMRRARALGSRLGPTAGRITGLSLAFVAAVAATALRHPSPQTIGRYTPAAAVAAARAHGVAGPVLNDYNFGGYLIFEGIAPFIDGRFDMYGDAFLAREGKLAELPALLADYRIGWTLVGATSQRAVLMDHLPGWHRIYGDDIAVVHVRDGTP
ncbi:MAG: hypothetical protein HY060_24050 [Proteobacteria bacterium]|nr:hypothetical protein [Pseudomonadota bacterium]